MKKNELEMILQEGEGYKIEFKKSVNSDLSKELAAMANSSGGRIFIGINDDNEIIGTEKTNKLLSQIQDMASSCDPGVAIEIESFENILIVHVKEGMNKPYRANKGFYFRNGANSQKMTTREITEYIQAEGKVRFDEILRDDLDIKNILDIGLLDEFLHKANISKTLDNFSILHNLSVLSYRDNVPFLNNAGVLFFTKEPVNYLFHTIVTCVLFKGTERHTILDKKDFSRDIVENIENTMVFLKQHLKLRYEITSLRRKEIPEIPEVALREAVINAVCHRDYFEKGANVLVAIFDDKVEITNPGGLPKGLSSKDFGKKSIARNPIIASLFQRNGYIEKMGTGISRIRTAAKESGIQEPVFSFNTFFTVEFPREIPDAEEKTSGITTQEKVPQIKADE
ncbi:MAG: putative DNA binding domain-containing protein, partial [Bacteroidetes bacterium]|nr:putative DNA binding domain-containing protein [Bacteroidota bacterium]